MVSARVQRRARGSRSRCGGLGSITDLFTDSFEVDSFSGDPFPIVVDTSTGAVIVGVSCTVGRERSRRRG